MVWIKSLIKRKHSFAYFRRFSKATRSWYASWLCTQTSQNVPGHQNQRRSESTIQRRIQENERQHCRYHQFFFKNQFLFFLFDTSFELSYPPDSINIKILNAGAWARGSDRVTVSLPLELEDYIPEVEDFYRKKHSGRKLQWHHHMSNGTVRFNFLISKQRKNKPDRKLTECDLQIQFANAVGRFDLDVTTFQMAVLFAWNERPKEKISLENLRLATELPDAELRRTLWVPELN